MTLHYHIWGVIFNFDNDQSGVIVVVRFPDHWLYTMSYTELVMCQLGLEATGHAWLGLAQTKPGQAMCSALAAPGSGLEFCKPEAMAWVAVHSHYLTTTVPHIFTMYLI